MSWAQYNHANNRVNKDETPLTKAWLDAIECATACLRNGRINATDSSFVVVDSSIQYLESLESQLSSKRRSKWHKPPTQFPPQSPQSLPSSSSAAVPLPLLVPGPGPGPIPALSLTPSQVHLRHTQQPRASNNPFETIALSDEEQDEESSSTTTSSNDATDEAGDQPVWNRDHGMTILRLLIRIGTSSSDLWTAKGRALSAAHEWTAGADALQQAIHKVRQALDLADTEITKFYLPTGPTNNTLQRQQELQEDADIVHVAIQSLVRARDKYIQMAKRQIQYLEQILQPQWESRDRIKERIGEERWINNPHPKQDHARLRQQSEAELRLLQEALDSLEDEKFDGVSASAQFLKLRLLPTNHHRYNGKRPEDLIGTNDAVSRLEGYPDATSFGWTFTGSNPTSHVEFFERMEDMTLVKLDFYYTTGTVKTSMDHPRQGKTQMFASQDQITPELYMEILQNPRVHTDRQRYQTRENKPPSRTRNGDNNNNNNNDGYNSNSGNQRPQQRHRGQGRGRGRGRGRGGRSGRGHGNIARGGAL